MSAASEPSMTDRVHLVVATPCFGGQVSSIYASSIFQLQRAVSTVIRDLGHDYWTGTVYTTNRRVWEHDDGFKEQLRRTRSMAIDCDDLCRGICQPHSNRRAQKVQSTGYLDTIQNKAAVALPAPMSAGSPGVPPRVSQNQAYISMT